jgi:hypothetical protein
MRMAEGSLNGMKTDGMRRIAGTGTSMLRDKKKVLRSGSDRIQDIFVGSGLSRSKVPDPHPGGRKDVWKAGKPKKKRKKYKNKKLLFN